MKVGDLVRYKDEKWRHWVGIVQREVPGWGEIRVIRWFAPEEITSSNPKNEMEVISESR